MMNFKDLKEIGRGLLDKVIRLKKLRKTTKQPQDIRCPSWESKRSRTELNSAALLLYYPTRTDLI
jgi:hypothetical protein